MLGMFTNSALSEEDTALFLDYLKTMVRVNLPLDVGLRRLAKEATSRRIRELAAQLESNVARGSTLVESLRRSQARLPPLVIALLEAGERSGNLAEMLEYTSRHCRASIRLANSFRQALLYPKLVIGLIIFGVIPVAMFAAASTSQITRDIENVPTLTRVVTWLSLTVVGHPFVILGLGALVALALFHPVGPLRRFTAWLQLRLPYVGDLYRATLTASLARGVGLLVRSGVPLQEAVAKLNLDPENPIVTQALADLAERLGEGQSFSAQIARIPLFPDSFSWLVSLGETGENLDEVLIELSDFYEEDARHRGEMAARVMEPAFLLLLALVVGPVVLAVFAPIVQMVASMDF